ncbi:hypothetical protein [Oscillatoria sp. FACHB-1406]|uniref:hypothetical protein n=1 Tax=Oscillatoria sp. FACHB-1406 TaxID=2692846 RepID=UPI0016835FC9|nr:hypothetical protein [Oscillatoria sp. FACHB-1406]MBD2578406.1 hypothetical protein [Oscillatoria sp. FACHB-1406]
MFDKTWRSLKNFFQSSDNSTTARVTAPTTASDARSIPSLSDEDCAFLFEQLLEGVSHGWQTLRVQRFFEQLGEQGSHVTWVHWLQRYYAPKVLASPTPDLELAQKLTLLAQQTQYLPKIMEVGAMSNAIAQELQRRATRNPILEYSGIDADESYDAPEVKYVTPDELLLGIQQDENLAQQIASQLGVSETDPEILLRLLLERFQVESPDSDGG